MQDWANRIGLTLQFLSLWLVTPQIIGEDVLLQGAAKLGAGSRRIRKAANGCATQVLSCLIQLLSGCFLLLAVIFIVTLGFIYGFSSAWGAPIGYTVGAIVFVASIILLGVCPG